MPSGTQSGPDLQNVVAVARLERRGHRRDHIRLRDRLPFAYRQRPVLVRLRLEPNGNEDVTRHLAHDRQHSRVRHAARRDLLRYHPLARVLTLHDVQLIIHPDARPHKPRTTKPPATAVALEPVDDAASLRPDRERHRLVRTLRRRDVPHACRLAMSGVQVQDRLLRLVIGMLNAEF